LFLRDDSLNLAAMLSRFLLGCALATVATAQTAQVELANLREDVRGLVQRVGELTLRLEQLERENGELKKKSGDSTRAYATVEQLNDAVADLNRTIKTAATGAKNEALQQVSVQIEKLAKQTNAAIDSLAKSQATRPTVQATFAEDYAKEGVSYTVQKGDSLAAIAKKTGAKQQDIVNANKISDPARIVVGQTLFIPSPKEK
jgi:nucleoid-associated protein YgaU